MTSIVQLLAFEDSYVTSPLCTGEFLRQGKMWIDDDAGDVAGFGTFQGWKWCC